ncbi:MAG TPA: peptidoglycan editing factor PgeF [Gammaproteobacteria bacterium]|nr:peptidoglycan editing factor PgeF [Gammaproteobacteria bacterium]
MDKSHYLPVAWPDNSLDEPQRVKGVTTLTTGGISIDAYREFNLATHVGDDPDAVRANRITLSKEQSLPAEPLWLNQVHSNRVVYADGPEYSDPLKTPDIQADAAISRARGIVCSVMTADCLPVFFCNRAVTEVAVAHAGWRGLHAGIISNTVAAMRSPADEIVVYLGPAIGPQAFEVGMDVFRAFSEKNISNESAFIATSDGHYLCDIYQLARIELWALGINQISGGDHCTFTDERRFYSYRRQAKTGRMANLIWLS